MGRVFRRAYSAIDAAGNAQFVISIGASVVGGGGVIAVFKKVFKGVPGWVLVVMLLGVVLIGVGLVLAAGERRRKVFVAVPHSTRLHPDGPELVADLWVTNAAMEPVRMVAAVFHPRRAKPVEGRASVITPYGEEATRDVPPGRTAQVECRFRLDKWSSRGIEGDVVILDQYNRRHLSPRLSSWQYSSAVSAPLPARAKRRRTPPTSSPKSTS